MNNGGTYIRRLQLLSDSRSDKTCLTPLRLGPSSSGGLAHTPTLHSTLSSGRTIVGIRQAWRGICLPPPDPSNLPFRTCERRNTQPQLLQGCNLPAPKWGQPWILCHMCGWILNIPNQPTNQPNNIKPSPCWDNSANRFLVGVGPTSTNYLWSGS